MIKFSERELELLLASIDTVKLAITLGAPNDLFDEISELKEKILKVYDEKNEEK